MHSSYLPRIIHMYLSTSYGTELPWQVVHTVKCIFKKTAWEKKISWEQRKGSPLQSQLRPFSAWVIHPHIRIHRVEARITGVQQTMAPCVSRAYIIMCTWLIVSTCKSIVKMYDACTIFQHGYVLGWNDGVYVRVIACANLEGLECNYGYHRHPIYGFRPQLLNWAHFIRKHVYLLLLIFFFFSLAIHGLIFRVLWLDSIVGGSNLSKYTAWRSQLGWIAKI